MMTELFRLINEANPTLPAPVGVGNVSVSSPRPMATPIQGGINAELDLTAIDGQGYTGKVRVYYPRQDIAAVWSAVSDTPPIVDGGLITWAEIKQALSADYGALFQALDLPVTPFVPPATLPATVTWQVPSTSLLFTGALAIALTESVLYPSLESALSVNDLDGLTAPAPTRAGDWTDPELPWVVRLRVAALSVTGLPDGMTQLGVIGTAYRAANPGWSYTGDVGAVITGVPESVEVDLSSLVSSHAPLGNLTVAVYQGDASVLDLQWRPVKLVSSDNSVVYDNHLQISSSAPAALLAALSPGEYTLFIYPDDGYQGGDVGN